MKRKISADFPFESKYVKVNGNQVHYIDEGNGDPILFLHGNPTSSYIWRNIIPYLSNKGRCIAVDLIGFGKSDQPDIDYGFTDVYGHLEGFIKQLDLKNLTIVVQDWGSGLGFHYAHKHPHNIKGIAFMEAMFKQMEWDEQPFDVKMAMNLIRWKWSSWLMLGVGNMFVGSMLPDGVNRKLTDQEMENYRKPFKTLKSRKPVYVFPRDVPTKGKPQHTARVVDGYHKWLTETKIPKIGFYVDPGMLIRMDQAKWIEKNFPNTEMVYLGKGTHFIQEDYPHEIGAKLAEWYEKLAQ